MKITQKQLQQIIKEELRKVLMEVEPQDPGTDVHQNPGMHKPMNRSEWNTRRLKALESAVAALTGWRTTTQAILQQQPWFKPVGIPAPGSAEEEKAKKIGRGREPE